MSAPVDPGERPVVLVVHGATTLPDGDTLDMTRFAETIGDAARLHRRGNHAPLCFGYSMGGYAALLLEAMSPGTLGGVVTLGTKFEWTPTDLGAAPLLTAQKLSAVRIPVRLAVGSRDDTVTVQEAGRIASVMARASAHVLPDIPHPIERVPATLVVDLIRDLARDLPPS